MDWQLASKSKLFSSSDVKDLLLQQRGIDQLQQTKIQKSQPNTISEQGSVAIFQAVMNCSSLEYLDLSGNPIPHSGIASILQTLSLTTVHGQFRYFSYFGISIATIDGWPLLHSSDVPTIRAIHRQNPHLLLDFGFFRVVPSELLPPSPPLIQESVTEPTSTPEPTRRTRESFFQQDDPEMEPFHHSPRQPTPSETNWQRQEMRRIHTTPPSAVVPPSQYPLSTPLSQTPSRENQNSIQMIEDMIRKTPQHRIIPSSIPLVAPPQQIPLFSFNVNQHPHRQPVNLQFPHSSPDIRPADIGEDDYEMERIRHVSPPLPPPRIHSPIALVSPNPPHIPESAPDRRSAKKKGRPNTAKPSRNVLSHPTPRDHFTKRVNFSERSRPATAFHSPITKRTARNLHSGQLRASTKKQPETSPRTQHQKKQDDDGWEMVVNIPPRKPFIPPQSLAHHSSHRAESEEQKMVDQISDALKGWLESQQLRRPAVPTAAHIRSVLEAKETQEDSPPQNHSFETNSLKHWLNNTPNGKTYFQTSGKLSDNPYAEPSDGDKEGIEGDDGNADQLTLVGDGFEVTALLEEGSKSNTPAPSPHIKHPTPHSSLHIPQSSPASSPSRTPLPHLETVSSPSTPHSITSPTHMIPISLSPASDHRYPNPFDSKPSPPKLRDVDSPSVFSNPLAPPISPAYRPRTPTDRSTAFRSSFSNTRPKQSMSMATYSHISQKNMQNNPMARNLFGQPFGLNENQRKKQTEELQASFNPMRVIPRQLGSTSNHPTAPNTRNLQRPPLSRSPTSQGFPILEKHASTGNMSSIPTSSEQIRTMSPRDDTTSGISSVSLARSSSLTGSVLMEQDPLCFFDPADPHNTQTRTLFTNDMLEKTITPPIIPPSSIEEVPFETTDENGGEDPVQFADSGEDDDPKEEGRTTEGNWVQPESNLFPSGISVMSAVLDTPTIMQQLGVTLSAGRFVDDPIRASAIGRIAETMVLQLMRLGAAVFDCREKATPFLIVKVIKVSMLKDRTGGKEKSSKEKNEMEMLLKRGNGIEFGKLDIKKSENAFLGASVGDVVFSGVSQPPSRFEYRSSPSFIPIAHIRHISLGIETESFRKVCSILTPKPTPIQSVPSLAFSLDAKLCVTVTYAPLNVTNPKKFKELSVQCRSKSDRAVLVDGIQSLRGLTFMCEETEGAIDLLSQQLFP
ncbi:hypothetical protein BLNAU_293 [Blattamonas nauphoetae]|uniref:Uncharacterized protein n=1 Tax=Blattamonas nauphoetae TaxID=2049346 RepID=A0ABQ9YMN5_9EUKA|nr:hypothetical protein BLNAU_293 [Blattamonas nauphoetae]